MIFKKPDTVPQMRSKPIHFHKQAQTHFRANCCRKDKILSIIFVKHFCWDFQTCLSQFFFADKGAWGAPMEGGPPISRNQSPPAETSRNQSPSAIGAFQLENRWPRGVGANFLGVGPIGPPPLPFSLKIVGPGWLGQLPGGARGPASFSWKTCAPGWLGATSWGLWGAPRGESPIALVVSTHMVWDLGIRELSTNKLERGLSLKGIFGKDF